MGYYTYISGDGFIKPPLDDAKLKEFTTDEGSYFEFEQIPGDQTVQLVNGTPTVVGNDPGRTLVRFGYDDSGKFYDFHDQLDQLAQLCARNSVMLNCEFDGDGEESHDFWKARVTDNQLEISQGQIAFDDDSTKKAQARSEIVDLLQQLNQTQAHGNVIPRKDGTRDLTCPGLPTCMKCRTEQEALRRLIWDI